MDGWLLTRLTAQHTASRRSRRLAALALAIALPALATTGAARAQARQVPVDDEASLAAAMAAAEPGDVIALAPGVYEIDGRLRADRPGLPERPITLRAARPGEATLRFRADSRVVEGFHVTAPDWRFENLVVEGACARDDDCEHAFHIVGAADRTVVRGSELRDFNAQVKGNGAPVGQEDAWVWPDDVLLEGNELYNRAPRETANPVTPIDVVGGRRWVVRANHIHDHAKAGGNRISYAAFFKGNSRDGLFERNLVVCEQLHRGQIRLGLSLGGGGSSPDRICEDGTCTPEHRGGILRNNLIAHCPADVGIYLNEATDTRVLHNTLYRTTGIDVRFAASSAELQGNLLSGRIRERDGGRASLQDNRAGLDEATFRAWFADPDALDFALRQGDALVDGGAPDPALPDDYCGAPRDARPDLGALEYVSARPCDTSRPAWPAPGATPGASATATTTRPPPTPSTPGASASPPARPSASPSATPRATPVPAPLFLPRLERSTT